MPNGAAPDLRGLTDDEIWDRLHHGQVGSPLYDQAKLTLQLRNLERQTQASAALSNATAQLVAATTQLVAATNRLGAFTQNMARATWALFLGSAVLAIATIGQLLIRR